MLQNAHNAPNLLLALESILDEIASAAPPDSMFRIWIASQALAEALPVRLIQNCVRTITDTPKVCLLNLIICKINPILHNAISKCPWQRIHLKTICENIMGKEENAGNQYFLLFAHSFFNPIIESYTI